ncbi:MAG: SRPBCC family protein [Chthoniobacterales bacterium]
MNCSRSSISPALRPFLAAALVVCALFPAGRLARAADEATNWTPEGEAKGVVVHSRIRAGSSFKEFRGSGLIDASPAAVFAVIDDSEAYPHFMPYTAEVRVLKREKDSVVAYQRLELPLISGRDYTLRSENTRWLGPDGPIFRIRWEPANDLGPSPTPGVLRVKVCEGGWLLEPQGKDTTRATYTIYTDSGGTVPPMLANSGSKMAIRKVFEAIRKQVKEPKYAHASAANAVSAEPASPAAR